MLEANESTATCLDDTLVPLEFQNAVRAVQIVSWLQEVLVNDKQLTFDEQGRLQEQANL